MFAQTSERREARLTLKVPPDTFEPLMAGRGQLGLPLKRESNAQDVTGQVVDLEGRLPTSTASAERLQALELQVVGPPPTTSTSIAVTTLPPLPCEEPAHKGVGFFDSAGRPAGGIGVSIRFSGEGPGFLSCSDQPCPPGTYTAVSTFGPFRSPPATFTVN